jgi:hypothetical protein
MALSSEDIAKLAAQFGGKMSTPVANQSPSTEPKSTEELTALAAQFGGVMRPSAPPSDVPQLDALGQVIPQQQPVAVAEPSFGQRLIGVAEAAGTLGTGMTTGLVGGARGLAEGLMERIMSDKIGAYEGAKLMERRFAEEMARATYQPQTELGQQYTQKLGEMLSVVPPVLPLAPELIAAGRLAKPAVIATPTAQRAAAGIEAAKAATEKKLLAAKGEFPDLTGKAIATIQDVVMPERRAEIARILKEEPDSADVVRFRLINDQVRPDREADSVLKQGWKPGVVANVKAATDEDRKKMTQMLNLYKIGKRSERFSALNRPADIVGQSIDDRVKFINATRKKAGQEIDKIADTQLRGQFVDYSPAINQFLADLNKIGVSVQMDKNGIARAMLRNSDIQGNNESKLLLNRVLERLSDINAPDAYGIHTAKRFIDEQVNYGKQNLENRLSIKTERIVKDLRRNLNQTLKEKFPEYGAANDTYSNTTTALDDLQDAVGTRLDFDGENAYKDFGQASRKLLSNYNTRVALIDSLDAVDKVASKYGMPIKDDILNQVIFANEMDRMFGAPAATSLKGQMSQAMKTGVDIAKGRAADVAMELATAGLEKAQGINEENAIKAMEKILSRQKPKPKTSPSTTLQVIK